MGKFKLLKMSAIMLTKKGWRC